MSLRTELQALYERDGFLSPEQVLEAATPADSPLHQYFEWDDTEAARRYRLVQARGHIMRIKATIVKSPDETLRVRSYVSVPSADGSRQYVSTQEALTDERRDVVIQQAMREVAALRRKYQALIDFDKVLAEALAKATTDAA